MIAHKEKVYILGWNKSSMLLARPTNYNSGKKPKILNKFSENMYRGANSTFSFSYAGNIT